MKSMVFAILVHTRINASVYRPTIGQIGRIYFFRLFQTLAKSPFPGRIQLSGCPGRWFRGVRWAKYHEIQGFGRNHWFSMIFDDDSQIPIASLEVKYLRISDCVQKIVKKIGFSKSRKTCKQISKNWYFHFLKSRSMIFGWYLESQRSWANRSKSLDDHSHYYSLSFRGK